MFLLFSNPSILVLTSLILVCGIFYFRNENFCGEDAIRISTKNKNGVNALDIPIFVDPINDPPFIRVPYYIILRSNEDVTLIFDRDVDKFDFFIGDRDLLTFPGRFKSVLVLQ